MYLKRKQELKIQIKELLNRYRINSAEKHIVKSFRTVEIAGCLLLCISKLEEELRTLETKTQIKTPNKGYKAR